MPCSLVPRVRIPKWNHPPPDDYMHGFCWIAQLWTMQTHFHATSKHVSSLPSQSESAQPLNKSSRNFLLTRRVRDTVTINPSVCRFWISGHWWKSKKSWWHDRSLYMNVLVKHKSILYEIEVHAMQQSCLFRQKFRCLQSSATISACVRRQKYFPKQSSKRCISRESNAGRVELGIWQRRILPLNY